MKKSGDRNSYGGDPIEPKIYYARNKNKRKHNTIKMVIRCTAAAALALTLNMMIEQNSKEKKAEVSEEEMSRSFLSEAQNESDMSVHETDAEEQGATVSDADAAAIPERPKKSKIKNAIVWCAALIAAVLVVNLMNIAYHMNPSWITREDSATNGIWDPGALLVHGSEGFGVYRVDENGYMNEGTLKDKGYILAVGSSQTQGKELMNGDRYTDILNEKYREDGLIGDGELLVYNVSQDAYYLPYIINGFKAIISEFPDSSAVILETGYTMFYPEMLEECAEMHGYDPNQRGSVLAADLSGKEKVKSLIKETFPIIDNIRTQLKGNGGEGDQEEADDEETFDKAAYENALDKAFGAMKAVYAGDIYIMYHPDVSVDNTGMELVKEDTEEIFSGACMRNGIYFVDLGADFMSNYEKSYEVPYGFYNTTMGSGHLNKYGHRAIAEALYKSITVGDN